MRADTSLFSAYQGKGWKPRKLDMRADIRSREGIWACYQADSEHKPLEAVLLYCPGKELLEISNPNEVQHLERINLKKIKKEFDFIRLAFEKFNVSVHFINSQSFPNLKMKSKYNLMYVRDLFFNTKEGAIVSRMASEIRKGEEKFAASALSGIGVPIARTIGGKGLFEGADAIWLSPDAVVVGLGNRTNQEGFDQLSWLLKAQQVECISVRLPKGIQHLLGILQIVDKKMALVRIGIAPQQLLNLLAERGFSIVSVPETKEVLERQAMNIVALGPRTVIMPEGCPETRRLYRKSGLTVAAELDITELAKGAGGLACAAGILSRRI